MLNITNLSYFTKSGWGIGKKQILHDISLSVSAGEAFGFLGKNGAGKTTTIKCILGFLANHSGEITINGVPHILPRSRAHLGFVAEHPYFYDQLTIREALSLFAELSGVSKGQVQERCSNVLTQMGLLPRQNDKLRSLSKGLTQQFAIAQAIVADPRLLILDEPFSGLDPVGRVALRELLMQLKKNGTTLFISSHLLSDIELLCDTVSIIVNGRIATTQNLSTLRNEQAGEYTVQIEGTDCAITDLYKESKSVKTIESTSLITFSSRAQAESALRYSLNQGIPVVSYQQAKLSLEALFTQVTSSDLKEEIR